MTKRERAARRTLEECAERAVTLRIEGYIAARNAETRREKKPACPHLGDEAMAWEAGWAVGSRGSHWRLGPPAARVAPGAATVSGVGVVVAPDEATRAVDGLGAAAATDLAVQRVIGDVA